MCVTISLLLQKGDFIYWKRDGVKLVEGEENNTGEGGDSAGDLVTETGEIERASGTDDEDVLDMAMDTEGAAEVEEEDVLDMAMDTGSGTEEEDNVHIGDVVAVAYDDNWYVGEVRAIKEGGPEVRFLHRKGGSKTQLLWPTCADIQIVDKRQIIDRSVKLNIYKQRRPVIDTDVVQKLDHLYRRYAEKYIK